MMRAMYLRLKRLYLEGQAKQMHLDNAVKKRWLTKEEYDLIIKTKNEEDKEDIEAIKELQE